MAHNFPKYSAENGDKRTVIKQKVKVSPPHHNQYMEDTDSDKSNSGKYAIPSISCPGNHLDKSAIHSKHHHHYSYTSDLWTDGLLCAYEFIPAVKNKVQVGGRFGQKSGPVQGNFTAEITMNPATPTESPAAGQSNQEGAIAANIDSKVEERSDDPSLTRKKSAGSGRRHLKDLPRNEWEPIGWERIGELVNYVQNNSVVAEEMTEDVGSDDDSIAIADQAVPFWQVPAGPIWWCHVLATHPNIINWLTCSQWLHPAISSGLRDESRLISERMKHLFYEVPVRVGGGLLFELLGQSVGDPHHNEDDIPVVLRTFTSLNFLITAMHVKGDLPNGPNVIGISEVQDIVGAGGSSAPRTAHEVVALLADRLARWDDRLFRKHYFGEADEVELKFVNRRGNEDLALLSIILNQEIRRLSTEIIRVKWALHAREEILYELLVHLRGKITQAVLNKIVKSTRIMLDEQEAVRDRLFTVQDVMQSNVRAALQDKSVRVQHNLGVIGGGGLLLSIITGLFGVNLGGIPGSEDSIAFPAFTFLLFAFGILIVVVGMMYYGLRKPITEEQLASRKKELQNLVKRFQNSAESHEKVRGIGSSRREERIISMEDIGDDYTLLPTGT